MITLTHGSPLIRGPEPMVAVKPIGSWVKFKCVVNITELPPGSTFLLFDKWRVDGNKCSRYPKFWANGPIMFTTFERPVTINYIRPVSVQCGFFVAYSRTRIYGIASQFGSLTAYGKIIIAMQAIASSPFLCRSS